MQKIFLTDKDFIPNLFIVGAAKSGTTSLFHYLGQHSKIFTPRVKEPYYFIADQLNSNPLCQYDYISNNISDYLALFETSGSFSYRVDASVFYLPFRGTAKKILNFNPKSKIIIGLREPVSRLISHYQMHYTMHGTISKKFTEFINDPIGPEGINLVDLGLYYKQVKEYLEVFGKENIFIYLFDDLVNNRDITLKDLCSFLEIESFNISDIEKSKKNYSGMALSPLVHHLINRENILRKSIKNFLPLGYKIYIKKKINNWNIRKWTPPIKIINEIKAYYLDDIEKLENLIHKDLTDWKK